MRFRKMSAALVWVAGILSTTGWAGTTTASATAEQPLNWESCVTMAQAQNPTLVSARDQVQSKEDLFSSSYNSLFPDLTLGYSYSTSSLSSPALDSNSVWQHQVQGNVSWDLFNLKDYASMQSAGAALDQARFDLQLASAQVRFQLRQAYFQLLYAQEQITLLEQIRKIRETNARMVALSYKSGRESKGNMMITQADLSAAEADLAQAQRSLRVAQQALNHALGRQENEPVLVQNEFYIPGTPRLEDFAGRLPNLPQLKHDDAVLAQSRALLQQSWSQVVPNLSANYSRGWVGQTFFPPNNEWNASLNLTWPIFANGPTYSYFAVASAQAQVDKSESDKTADIQQLQAAAESSWSGLMSGIDQVQVQKQYQDAALQRNDEATIEYANGLLVFENWNQVVTSLVTFQKQYLSARLNAVLAEIAWQNALEITLEEK